MDLIVPTMLVCSACLWGPQMAYLTLWVTVIFEFLDRFMTDIL